jgi:hypothetical protein
MARVYHRDQAGAPALTYTSAVTIAQFAAFKAVLKACLVNGYGGIPAAGWLLVNEGEYFLVLRNGSASGYVCFSTSPAAPALMTIHVSATYTGMSGNVMTGDGLKTGKSAGNNIPHKQTLHSFVRSDLYCCWTLVADESTFVMGLGGSYSFSNVELIGTSLTDYGSLGTLYVGEDTAGNFIVCGGRETTGSTSTTATYGFSSAGFTSLRHPATGLLVDTGSIAVDTAPLFDGYGVNGLDATPLPKAYLAPLAWTSGGASGHFRGLCVDPGAMASAVSIGAQRLGHVGAVRIRTINSQIPLDDGYVYLVAPRDGVSGPFFLLTNNPEFW